MRAQDRRQDQCTQNHAAGTCSCDADAIALNLLCLRNAGVCALCCVRRYGAQYAQEYIDATVTADALCVGEYWVDMQVRPWRAGLLCGRERTTRASRHYAHNPPLGMLCLPARPCRLHPAAPAARSGMAASSPATRTRRGSGCVTGSTAQEGRARPLTFRQRAFCRCVPSRRVTPHPGRACWLQCPQLVGPSSACKVNWTSTWGSPLPRPPPITIACVRAMGVQEAIKRTELWRLRDKDGKPSGLLGW